MPSFHIYIHFKQNGKVALDYPNDVNFSRKEVEDMVRKYENGDDFLLGGFTIHSDPAHIKKFEIWETSSELPPPVDWNNMWRIAELVTKKFTTSIPGGRRVSAAPKEEKDHKECARASVHLSCIRRQRGYCEAFSEGPDGGRFRRLV